MMSGQILQSLPFCPPYLERAPKTIAKENKVRSQVKPASGHLLPRILARPGSSQRLVCEGCFARKIQVTLSTKRKALQKPGFAVRCGLRECQGTQAWPQPILAFPGSCLSPTSLKGREPQLIVLQVKHKRKWSPARVAGPETRPASSGEQQLPDLLSAPPLGDG